MYFFFCFASLLVTDPEDGCVDWCVSLIEYAKEES